MSNEQSISAAFDIMSAVAGLRQKLNECFKNRTISQELYASLMHSSQDMNNKLRQYAAEAEKGHQRAGGQFHNAITPGIRKGMLRNG